MIEFNKLSEKEPDDQSILLCYHEQSKKFGVYNYNKETKRFWCNRISNYVSNVTHWSHINAPNGEKMYEWSFYNGIN